MTCPICKNENVLRIDTYKHIWYVCSHCTNAFSEPKKRYILGFLPHPVFAMQKAIQNDSGQMYDYFVADYHKEYCINNASEFIRDVIDKNNIELKEKDVLDISGGNGHFLDEIRKRGSNVYMTEINQPSLDYCSKVLGIPSYMYDINEDSLTKVVGDKKFDIILVRAAVMFCYNVDDFAKQLIEHVKPGGVIIYDRCVIPTIGTLLRTQYDQYSYFRLYQADYLVDCHTSNGFDLVSKEFESDLEMYVYDHDKYKSMRIIDAFYLLKALGRIPFDVNSYLRCRDRKRSRLIFKIAE